MSRLWCIECQHATCAFVSPCRRAGKPVHATSRYLKRMSLRHQVESGAPFNADRDLRMGIVIERGGLRDASASDFQHKSIIIDVTYADPQSGVHLRAGSTYQDG